MRKIKIIPIILICFILTSIRVYAYDPANSGFKYYEVQKWFFSNKEELSEIPTEVQEAWDLIGEPYMNAFNREKTTIFYTFGVKQKDRVDETGLSYNGMYYHANIIFTPTKKGRKFYSPQRGGKIYVYSDVKDKDVIIHEYGHALYDIYYYRIGFNTDFKETWNEIYEQNKKSLAKYDTNAKTNVLLNEEEGFAEAFRLFIKDPDKLEKKNRRVYYYMLNICQEVENFKE